jgi:hypothetical protein
VDHEIQDNIDIQCPWRKDAEAVRFKKHWVMEMRLYRGHGWVEAFQVSDLHNISIGTSEFLQGLSLLQGRSNRLFDQEMDACTKQRLRSSIMSRGGDTNRSGIQLCLGGKTLFNARVGRNSILLANLPGTGIILFDDSCQPNRMTRGF